MGGKMNNKGFIRIKALTIVTIIGILCCTLIPFLLNSYSKYLKIEYVKVAKKYIKEARENINSLEYKQLPEKNNGLLIKLNELNPKRKSPYGKFIEEYSYVIAINMGEYYDYYFASIDKNNFGIPIVHEKELNVDSVVYGKPKLSGINKVSNIDSLYIAGTLFQSSEESKKNDKNILLVPITGDLTVSYEFKKDTHKIYDNLIKNIDTDIYNKEVTINNGVIKYNNEILGDDYSNDINGVFRYLSFPNEKNNLYYSSFVTYNKIYAAGIINYSDDYKTSDIIFDSVPSIVINKNTKTVTEDNKKYLMWNLMAIYPDNNNYSIKECGALILRDTGEAVNNIKFDTSKVMVGKSSNGCELGNIFAIRKNNVNTNNKFYARGYIKYVDKLGNEYINYSMETVKGIVE